MLRVAYSANTQPATRLNAGTPIVALPSAPGAARASAQIQPRPGEAVAEGEDDDGDDREQRRYQVEDGEVGRLEEGAEEDTADADADVGAEGEGAQARAPHLGADAVDQVGGQRGLSGAETKSPDQPGEIQRQG